MGHYWSWDPKETWAFVTSMGYLALYTYTNIWEETGKNLPLVASYCVYFANDNVDWS
jgi:ABC-type transport system involved in cytochrome c biogenesis permease subunit